MDLDALLAPRDSSPPSGENLEYEDVFVAMEIAARPVGERQAGEEILEAADPNYDEVALKALAVMEASHDLRAGVTLATALLFTRGLAGFAEATSYVRGCLEQYWDSCHPLLDADDDDDPTMRINSLQALAAPEPVLRGLRMAPLTESRSFGRVTLRDILVATGQISLSEDETPNYDAAAISAAFRDTAPDTLDAVLDGARTSLENLRTIEHIFGERTPGQGPQLAEAVRLLHQIVQHVAAAAGADVEAGESSAAEPGAAEGAAAPAGPSAPGRITTPADVRRSLDTIITYYQKNEPSSPVPLILERAKRLVGADFMSIMNDMAPSGVDNVKLIGGLYDEEGE
jgi:type VI secretion system protein ImpA